MLYCAVLLRTAKVVPPQGPDLVLTANVPDIKFDVFVGNSLDVEADGGDGGDVLAELELVEDGGLARGVETQHEQAHLLGSEDLAHHLGELATHCGGLFLGFLVEYSVRRRVAVERGGRTGEAERRRGRLMFDGSEL